LRPFCLLHPDPCNLKPVTSNLAALIVSAVLATRYGERLAPAFGNDLNWNRYLAMLVIYLVSSLAIWIGFRFVRRIVNRFRLQEFDHQIGGLIGLVKGVLLCMVITFFAVTLSTTARTVVFNSYSGYYMSVALHRGVPLLPVPVRNKLGDLLNDFANNKLPQHPPTSRVPGRPPAAPQAPANPPAIPKTPERAFL
jgi:membrane protein required for colicin V production